MRDRPLYLIQYAFMALFRSPRPRNRVIRSVIFGAAWYPGQPVNVEYQHIAAEIGLGPKGANETRFVSCGTSDKITSNASERHLPQHELRGFECQWGGAKPKQLSISF